MGVLQGSILRALMFELRMEWQNEVYIICEESK